MLDFIIHIDDYLGQMIANYGHLTYAILFAIVFLETGLVFTPFLPGDSLLFAAGAFSALGSFNVLFLFATLSLAAVLGDTANYWIGHFFGEKIIANPKIPINQHHIDQTNQFFARHGGKTIFLARFVPIIRTFAPFVAGVGRMHYSKFLTYNILGGVVWVGLFVNAGYFFGNIPWVKNNFSIIIIVIVVLSLTPMIIHLIHDRTKKILSSANKY